MDKEIVMSYRLSPCYDGMIGKNSCELEGGVKTKMENVK
jgi:hypothetical protein